MSALRVNSDRRRTRRGCGPTNATGRLQPWSQHRAFAFHVSARDLARLGQLCCNGSQHRGRNVIPADWGAASRPGHAVGYLTAEANIRQFLDIDTSILTAGNTRQVA